MKRVKKVWNYYRMHGLKLLLLKSCFPYHVKEFDYKKWRERHSLGEKSLKRQSEYVFEKKALISIAVPVYRTPERFLREMIESVLGQTCSEWELCIADGSENMDAYLVASEYAKKDQRIKVKRLSENKGIAENTNEALKMCSGDYIGLLDHDDVLAADAIYEIRRAIDKNNSPEVIYTDEDKMSIDGEEFFDPHFKPDYNAELLRSNNYICHFFVIRRDILQRVGGLRAEYDGAQDYDFILRCTDRAGSIIHIAMPLYHWRSHRSSTAENPESKLYAYEAGKRAIEDHLRRNGKEGNVEYTEHLGFYHVRYKQKSYDKVTIIIIKEGRHSSRTHIRRCEASIEKTCGYKNYHFIVTERLPDLDVSEIKGGLVLLVNSSVRMISRGWMEEMIGNCQREDIGAVGIKLYNRNETIRHGGIIQGKDRYAFEGFPRVRYGYFHRESIMQYMSAVTMDFMMMPTDIFLELRNEFPECLENERILCQRIRDRKKQIVYDPQIEAYILGESQRGTM